MKLKKKYFLLMCIGRTFKCHIACYQIALVYVDDHDFTHPQSILPILNNAISGENECNELTPDPLVDRRLDWQKNQLFAELDISCNFQQKIFDPQVVEGENVFSVTI